MIDLAKGMIRMVGKAKNVRYHKSKVTTRQPIKGVEQNNVD
jgi:hypothetical protein